MKKKGEKSKSLSNLTKDSKKKKKKAMLATYEDLMSDKEDE